MSESILKIAVCDDEETALEIITNALTTVFENNGQKTLIDKYRAPSDLEKNLPTRQYELLFLDIRLQNTDGIEFARRLRKEGNGIDIIFLSSCEERVFDTFSIRPVGFIRKSNFLKDTTEIVSSYMRKRQSDKASALIIQTDNNTKTTALPIQEITYIESYLKNQLIHVRGAANPFLTRATMSEYEEKLSPHGFMRVHKGYLVNHRCIREIGTTSITLTTGEEIPINRRNAGNLREEYLALMQKSHSLIL